jgi:hypothetical protein
MNENNYSMVNDPHNVKNNVKNIDENDEVTTFDDLIKDHYECYQIQIAENGECNKVYMGNYEEIPYPIIKQFSYKRFICKVVTPFLTKNDISNEKCGLIDINIFKNLKTKNALWKLSLEYSEKMGMYELNLYDIQNSKMTHIESLEKKSKEINKENILDYVTLKLLENPVDDIFKSKKMSKKMNKK